MLRIITGKFKGRKIEAPDSARPLTDRIKTSIFDTIQGIIEQADVLDCFSGSGSFGLEAISRGAKSCKFIELNNKAQEILKKNIIHLSVENTCSIEKSSVENYLSKIQKIEQDIIMVDPPFAMEKESKLKILSMLIEKSQSDEGSLIIFRIPTTDNTYFSNKFKDKLIFSKKFGVSIVNYYRNQK